MDPIATVRRIATLFLLGGGMALAQSALPATSPTAVPASIPAAVQPIPPRAGHPAQVSFTDGQLEVTADNSSLNQILRDIGRLIGMKITGGVTDDRVYGKYGPGAPGEILGDLLAGSGSNMLLRESASSAPKELILTPKQGGPSPPNPNAAGFDDEPPARQTQFDLPIRAPYVQPNHNPGFGNAPAGDPSQSSTPAAIPNPSTSGAQQSPNGVQTPQQIYQQLQRLQQAQPQPQK
jgi:hypothetical protein